MDHLPEVVTRYLLQQLDAHSVGQMRLVCRDINKAYVKNRKSMPKSEHKIDLILSEHGRITSFERAHGEGKKYTIHLVSKQSGFDVTIGDFRLEPSFFTSRDIGEDDCTVLSESPLQDLPKIFEIFRDHFVITGIRLEGNIEDVTLSILADCFGLRNMIRNVEIHCVQCRFHHREPEIWARFLNVVRPVGFEMTHCSLGRIPLLTRDIIGNSLDRLKKFSIINPVSPLSTEEMGFPMLLEKKDMKRLVIPRQFPLPLLSGFKKLEGWLDGDDEIEAFQLQLLCKTLEISNLLRTRIDAINFDTVETREETGLTMEIENKKGKKLWLYSKIVHGDTRFELSPTGPTGPCLRRR